VKTGALASAQFSPNQKLIVTADDSGTANIWNVSTHKFIAALNGHDYLYCAGFSPDGKLIVTAGDGVRIWSASTHKKVGPPILQGWLVRWAAFSADSKRIVTADQFGTARVWDARSGEQVGATLTEPGGGAMSGARFSPDGKSVVTSSDDGTARVWDWRTGALTVTFTEPGRSAVYNAVFSPDRHADTVLTASQDGTARIWSIKSGRELTAFNVGNLTSDAEFSPKGDRVVTAASNGVTRIFSIELAGPLSDLKKIARKRVKRKLTPSEIKEYG
jgi:WD40 repeat protein